VDGVAHDLASGITYSANGQDGTVSVITRTGDSWSVIQTPTTMKGARTIVVDPQTNRAYLPCKIPDAKDPKAPATFGIAVVGPVETKH